MGGGGFGGLIKTSYESMAKLITCLRISFRILGRNSFSAALLNFPQVNSCSGLNSL